MNRSRPWLLDVALFAQIGVAYSNDDEPSDRGTAGGSTAGSGGTGAVLGAGGESGITGEVASLTEPLALSGSTEGTYTISGAAGEPLTLEQTGYGCIDGIPGSCRTNTEIITLTPK